MKNRRFKSACCSGDEIFFMVLFPWFQTLFFHAYIFHYGNYTTKTCLTEYRSWLTACPLKVVLPFEVYKKGKNVNPSCLGTFENTSNGIRAQIWAVSCLKLILFLLNTWKHSASSLARSLTSTVPSSAYNRLPPNNQKKNAVNLCLTCLVLKVLQRLQRAEKEHVCFVDWMIRLSLSLNRHNVRRPRFCLKRPYIWTSCRRSNGCHGDKRTGGKKERGGCWEKAEREREREREDTCCTV